MRLEIWYYLYNLACNFTESNTPTWVFFTFLKFVQMILNCVKASHFKSKIDVFFYQKMLTRTPFKLQKLLCNIALENHFFTSKSISNSVPVTFNDWFMHSFESHLYHTR